jgi:hypothetical protein
MPHQPYQKPLMAMSGYRTKALPKAAVTPFLPFCTAGGFVTDWICRAPSQPGSQLSLAMGWAAAAHMRGSSQHQLLHHIRGRPTSGSKGFVKLKARMPKASNTWARPMHMVCRERL